MKRLLLMTALLAALAIPTLMLPADAARCTGSTPCNACKNCRYCKHCAELGGTCGVCRPRHGEEGHVHR